MGTRATPIAGHAAAPSPRSATARRAPLRSSLALVALVALVPAPASAQRAGPQRCGQDAASIDYGALQVGSVVVPQRHRFVGGDPNWDPRMARFLGRVARVTRLSGIDGRGCPGVRIDVDGGRFFWRARDLTIGDARPRRVLRAADPARLPQSCGRTDATASYGRLRVGSAVVIGRHRPVAGDDNWTRGMSAYVGRTARVVELAGTDEHGCPGVHLDVDRGEWFWRIRDLTRAEDGAASVAYVPGLANDHGRVAGARGAEVPQQCGMTDANARFGPVTVGAEVVLGRHREVGGDANWVEHMERYVGERARVTELSGVDERGCPLVRVDADDGAWYWRLRDLRVP